MRLSAESRYVDMNSIEHLCPNCGLCCNGVLFADVELQKGDNAGRLIDLGMALKKKGMKRAFAQPCHCFDGRLCRIYTDRPKRCATFECGLLKRVQSGEMPAPAALKRIADAKILVEKVRRLLGRLGDKDEYGNHAKGTSILIDAQNCLIHNHDGPAVAVIGLSDIMVISTPSGVLVAPLSRAQDVKKAAEAAKLLEK